LGGGIIARSEKFMRRGENKDNAETQKVAEVSGGLANREAHKARGVKRGRKREDEVN
jgi:hypothetical protein